MDSILIFIIVLGVLIFFHELGHFLVARLFGVGVERFSLGFGPRLFGKTVGRTDYRVSLIPLGGYVKMVGEEPDSPIDPQDKPLSFTHKHVAKRAMIVAAGPLFNVLLAIIILSFLFFFIGFPSIRPIVRNVEESGPGWEAGIREGDLIKAIDGETVSSWYEIEKKISDSAGQPLKILLERQDEKRRVTVVPQKEIVKDIFGDDVDYYQLGLSGIDEAGAMVKKVDEGMPAEKAGLEAGDRIVAIDGQKIERWETMHEMISSSKGRPMRFTIQRGQDTLDLTIEPVVVQDKDVLGAKQSVYRIGIHRAFAPIPENDQTTVRFNPVEAVMMGIERSWFITVMSGKFFSKMVQGKVPLETIGGPIRIAQMARQQANEGMMQLFFFVASISIQLAVLNLLPIPVLDGGHLLFYFIEAIQRKPVSTRLRETAQQIGIFILILLMILVFYNDITTTWFK